MLGILLTRNMGGEEAVYMLDSIGLIWMGLAIRLRSDRERK